MQMQDKQTGQQKPRYQHNLSIRLVFREFVGCIGKTETYIIVAVIGIVVVAIRNPRVDRVVVP